MISKVDMYLNFITLPEFDGSLEEIRAVGSLFTKEEAICAFWLYAQKQLKKSMIPSRPGLPYVVLPDGGAALMVDIRESMVVYLTDVVRSREASAYFQERRTQIRLEARRYLRESRDPRLRRGKSDWFLLGLYRDFF